MTVAALADWASTTRSCAAAHGKTNFYIPGGMFLMPAFRAILETPS